MKIVNGFDLMKYAQDHHYMLPAFNTTNLEMTYAIAKGLNKAKLPGYIQISSNNLRLSDPEAIVYLTKKALADNDVPIGLHLDHGKSYEDVKACVNAGFTSIMIDASHLPFEENIERTVKIVELAKKYGATVEAELGLVGGSEDGSEDHGIRCTNPDDAKIFVERTGIDALAVAIGNAHGNYPVAPKLAFDVLEQIHDKTGIPLVLHGGSGITDADFRKAIELGIVKVNIATASFNRLTKHAEEYLKSEGAHNYFDLNLAMVQGTYENVRHHIEVFNCEMPLDEVDA